MRCQTCGFTLKNATPLPGYYCPNATHHPGGPGAIAARGGKT